MPAAPKCIAATGASTDSSPMDADTTAYVHQHDLAFVLRTMDKLLRDIEDEVAPPVPAAGSTVPASASSSSSTFASRESAAIVSSPLHNRDDILPSSDGATAAAAEAVEVAQKASLENTLMLHLLLSSFTPLSLQGASASSLASASKGAPTRQLLSPLSPPSPLEAVKDPAEAPMSLPAAAAAYAWPSNVSCASREAAVKAEVCRSFAQHCRRLHTGRGLVESCGSRLRWADVSPAAGGHERLGVALALDVFRCWRHAVIPLMQATDSSVVPESAGVADASELLFNTLVAPEGRGTSYEICSYWCYTLLQGYCSDVAPQLWASIVGAAQTAAAAQARTWNGGAAPGANASDEMQEAPPAAPSLTCETLLLRSFLSHLACSPSEQIFHMKSDEDVIEDLRSQAVVAAMARSPVWAWSEVEELRTATAHTAGASSNANILCAVLCADGYWAAVLRPYSAMVEPYCLW